jgi:hypothetical protein
MIVMVRRRLMQTPPQLPRPGSRKQSKDSKEHARKLQPQNSRQPSKVPPHCLAKLFATSCQTLFILKHLRRRLNGLIHQPSPNRSRRSHRYPRLGSIAAALSLRCSAGRIRGSRRIRRSHQRLRSCTGSRTKRTTKANRVHTQKCSFSRLQRIVSYPNQRVRPHLHPTFCQQ